MVAANLIGFYAAAAIHQLFPYSEVLARHLLLLSAVAYRPQAEVVRWNFPNYNCHVGAFEVTKTFDIPEKSTFAFVGLDHQYEAIVAAFQGTKDEVNWVTDLSTWFRYGDECILGAAQVNTETPLGHKTSVGAPTSIGLVHRGFCEYYTSLSDLGLPEEIVALADLHPSYTIYTTGHSLGGAAATLAAADLSLRFGVPRERLQLYTFGAPRPGDASFGALIGAHVGAAYRVVHAGDVVPHLAPCCSSWTGGCATLGTCPYHAAQEVWYPSAMAVGSNHIVCEPVAEDDDCDNLFDRSIKDHQFYFGIHVAKYCAQVPTESASASLAADVAANEALMQLQDAGVLDRAGAS
eukprot:TRINITY_DN577_c0_g1_i1.p1 TRINITY_DN577_c0_g1~~TRINITY_DN577_c0_g1_i1.p1  ORF type:complete len:404 (-),score=46.99 TRINITY_DN577_c0_g1_i1:179-1228(-)